MSSRRRRGRAGLSACKFAASLFSFNKPGLRSTGKRAQRAGGARQTGALGSPVSLWTAFCQMRYFAAGQPARPAEAEPLGDASLCRQGDHRDRRLGTLGAALRLGDLHCDRAEPEYMVNMERMAQDTEISCNTENFLA